MGAFATALIAARGFIPNAWSILIANAVLATAYGTMWWGARSFEGRNTRVLFAIAGALLWLGACAVPAFYATATARAVLMSAIGVGYTVLAVFELWRSRDEKLPSRWPIIFLLVVHAAAIPVRIPLVASRAGTSFHFDLLTFVVFEALFLSICGAFLFGSIVKERFLVWYRKASFIDPLTGVANRRAFFEKGSKLLKRSAWTRTPVSLLLFDLDEFKAINDRFGHAIGDVVLIAFCEVATRLLRPADLLARLGGEEFASLLPAISQEQAAWIADRVREAFENISHTASDGSFSATVSVGIASSDDGCCELAGLLAQADRALYRAKKNGRNRVEKGVLADSVSVQPLPQTA